MGGPVRSRKGDRTRGMLGLNEREKAIKKKNKRNQENPRLITAKAFVKAWSSGIDGDLNLREISDMAAEHIFVFFFFFNGKKSEEVGDDEIGRAHV